MTYVEGGTTTHRPSAVDEVNLPVSETKVLQEVDVRLRFSVLREPCPLSGVFVQDGDHTLRRDTTVRVGPLFLSWDASLRNLTHPGPFQYGSVTVSVVSQSLERSFRYVGDPPGPFLFSTHVGVPPGVTNYGSTR